MTDDINYLNLARYVSGLEQQIGEEGIQLELRTDFGYFMRICEDLEGKPPPNGMFNPMHQHIGPENGFWIKGTNPKGEIVHVQAIRIDDMSGTNLTQELESQRAFYTDPSVSAERGEECISVAPITEKITDRVCYHGEMWLKGGKSGFRGKSLPGLLSRLIHAVALAKWQPDFVYGFAYDTLIKNGVMINYGYWHMQPRAVKWTIPSRDLVLDMWLVWLTKSDLIDFVTHRREQGWHFQERYHKGIPALEIHPVMSEGVEGADTGPREDLCLAEV
jgi:hypothetical protein